MNHSGDPRIRGEEGRAGEKLRVLQSPIPRDEARDTLHEPRRLDWEEFYWQLRSSVWLTTR